MHNEEQKKTIIYLEPDVLEKLGTSTQNIKLRIDNRLFQFPSKAMLLDQILSSLFSGINQHFDNKFAVYVDNDYADDCIKIKISFVK